VAGQPYGGTYARLMAEYNVWMNERVYAGAASLSDESRKRDRGAFFRSIHATLDHILWIDRVWMTRFAGRPYPSRPAGVVVGYDDFDELRTQRAAMDRDILAWSVAVTPAELDEPMTWTAATYGFTQTHPRWVQVAQMFNHQTHHRGQVHAMLTAAGVDVGATDLPVIPLLAQ
jgi:uncharacterized damage-inducible protein DinB